MNVEADFFWFKSKLLCTLRVTSALVIITKFEYRAQDYLLFQELSGLEEWRTINEINNPAAIEIK